MISREHAKEVLENLVNNEVLKSVLLRTDIEAMKCAISALTEELSEDGTLTVHVSDCSKVKRVLVMGDNIFGGLYYPDSENKGEWISQYDEDGKTGWYECSCCHSERAFNTNFCPDCGADMRGET